MALKGNKGEWSEIYALFKLLGDGKVHAGDANINQLSLYYPILNVIRQELKCYEYKPDTNRSVVIISEDGNVFTTISMNDFSNESKKLFDEIKKNNAASFAIPGTETFMNQIGCTKLKAPSKDKADIHIIIHDSRTNINPLLGFSVKSQLGSPSTLLNAGHNTNITYKIIGKSLSDAEISQINQIEKHSDRIRELCNKGVSLVFFCIENDTFRNNLLFLDCYMPQFIADCLSINTIECKSSIPDVVTELAKKNPVGFTGSDIDSFYAHKMKVLLLDSALGMTPGKEWTGKYDANGGFLVVKEDGEIVCYHFYKKNEVEDYLYNNTRFENGSRGRYNYGFIYRGADGEAYLKLNLQIRFKK